MFCMTVMSAWVYLTRNENIPRVNGFSFCSDRIAIVARNWRTVVLRVLTLAKAGVLGFCDELRVI